MSDSEDEGFVRRAPAPMLTEAMRERLDALGAKASMILQSDDSECVEEVQLTCDLTPEEVETSYMVEVRAFYCAHCTEPHVIVSVPEMEFAWQPELHHGPDWQP